MDLFLQEWEAAAAGNINCAIDLILQGKHILLVVI
jgi:hypothetical protein